MIFARSVALKTSVAAGMVLLCLCAGASVKLGPDMSLEDLTKGSDAAIIGKCTSKQAYFVGNHIETTYQVQVTESLKGKMAAGSNVELTVIGGEMTTPPITLYAELQPHMIQDEDVALFLKNPPTVTPERQKRLNPQSKLLSSMQIYGWNEGKFSVLTDLTDGKQKVAKINLENFGYIHTDTALNKVLRAVASHELKVTSGPVIQLSNGLYTTPSGKAMVDKALADEHLNDLPQVKRANPSEITEEIKKNRSIQLQDLQEFKDQVRKFAK